MSLAAYRRSRLLSQKDLAERSGVSSREITRIEGGEHYPQGRTIRRLLRAFGLPNSDAGLVFGPKKRRATMAGIDLLAPDDVLMGALEVDVDGEVGCGFCRCTENAPCEGGCSWSLPGVCSRCAANLATSEAWRRQLHLARTLADDGSLAPISMGMDRGVAGPFGTMTVSDPAKP